MEKVSWKDIGLVNTREMFKKAMAGKYAIPAYNFNNMEQLQAIVMGCVESKSPVHPAGLERRAQVREPDPPALPRHGRGCDDQGRELDRSSSPCTWTTAIPSSSASPASIPASPRS